LDGLAAFWTIGRRIGWSGSESGGELDGRAAYWTVWRHFGRSVGELDGRSANQAVNWTVGRRIGRYSEDVKDKGMNDFRRRSSKLLGRSTRFLRARCFGTAFTKRFDGKSSFSIANCIDALKVERFLANIS
jgi:hypothetical protein